MRDHNDLLNEMEINERKAQLATKERERQFHEERSKFNKKVEQMGKTISSLTEDIANK